MARQSTNNKKNTNTPKSTTTTTASKRTAAPRRAATTKKTTTKANNVKGNWFLNKIVKIVCSNKHRSDFVLLSKAFYHISKRKNDFSRLRFKRCIATVIASAFRSVTFNNRIANGCLGGFFNFGLDTFTVPTIMSQRRLEKMDGKELRELINRGYDQTIIDEDLKAFVQGGNAFIDFASVAYYCCILPAYSSTIQALIPDLPIWGFGGFKKWLADPMKVPMLMCAIQKAFMAVGDDDNDDDASSVASLEL